MKSISSLINLNSFRSEDKKKIIDGIDANTANIINKLFSFFESVCKGFERQYKNKDSKLNLEKIHWIRGFIDYGINTIEQIEFGIKRCRIEGPVNTPTIGQFLRWCTPDPEKIGLPSREDALKEICRNAKPYENDKKWSHPAIYHLYNSMDKYDLNNLSRDKLYERFNKKYDEIINLSFQGYKFSKIRDNKFIEKKYENNSIKKIENNVINFSHCNSREKAIHEMRNILNGKRS